MDECPKRDKPQWTRTPPSEPGYYWWTSGPGCFVSVCVVWEAFRFEGQVDRPRFMMAQFPGRSEQHLAERLGGHWQKIDIVEPEPPEEGE